MPPWGIGWTDGQRIAPTVSSAEGQLLFFWCLVPGRPHLGMVNLGSGDVELKELFKIDQVLDMACSLTVGTFSCRPCNTARATSTATTLSPTTTPPLAGPVR